MERKAIRDGLYEQFARIGRALSHPKRLHLVNLLCHGAKPVERLAEQTEQSVANASAHLKVLREACLVRTHREGRYIYYELADEAVLRLWLSLQEVSQSQHAEVREVVRQYFSDQESLVPLDVDTLQQRSQTGEVVVLDLRPEDEFAAGHLPGARSVPFAALDALIDTLPSDKELWAYCRGPYCVMTVQAVERLRERGYQAFRLSAGVAEWKAAGRSLETTPYNA